MDADWMPVGAVRSANRFASQCDELQAGSPSLPPRVLSDVVKPALTFLPYRQQLCATFVIRACIQGSFSRRQGLCDLLLGDINIYPPGAGVPTVSRDVRVDQCSHQRLARFFCEASCDADAHHIRVAWKIDEQVLAQP